MKAQSAITAGLALGAGLVGGAAGSTIVNGAPPNFRPVVNSHPGIERGELGGAAGFTALITLIGGASGNVVGGGRGLAIGAAAAAGFAGASTLSISYRQ